ncbi:beta-lactamase family protein [Spirosoma sp. KCTC 42546]|uniref:serine hydrolase domain-containing protein n=1 Tax=Spirosoma sp. KCTC 42546 TaxID=2520506 RepID=UPI0011570E8E|nr:serine hydrolase domain-containing protein [Spirosoma sp. KCTC 42546]QDK78338.1 beta-lactamase family protein [Spirosoma sp. KCTC 42546]
MTKPLLLLACALLTSPISFAQAPPDTLAAKVDKLFSEWNGTGRPGAAVGVVHGGKLIYAKGFGDADIETGAPITPTTIFHVASVSKEFTAYGIVLLAQEGKLSLDDDIHKYLPEVPDFGQKITIRHLIHHTSGLRDQWALLTMAGWGMSDVITKEHIFNLVRRQKELNFIPGAESLYCNTGYTLLAEIVARVGKQPFREWMKQKVFMPLGMKNTLFYDDDERIVKGRAYSFHRSFDISAGFFKKSVLSYANAGATSLFTTVEDLAKWINNFKNPTVGNAATMTQMLQRGRLTNGDSISYAFALVHGTHKGVAYYGHNGADAGFRSSISYFPKEDYGFIVLSNQAEANPTAKVLEMADLYLAPYLQKTKEAPAPPKPATTDTKPDKIVNADYIGRYYSPELETIYTIRQKGDALELVHVHHGEVALKPVDKDKFSTGWWFASTIETVRNPKNTVAGLRISNGRVRNLWLMRLPDGFDAEKPPVAGK